jgi:CheY-like chemotaxis protein
VAGLSRRKGRAKGSASPHAIGWSADFQSISNPPAPVRADWKSIGNPRSDLLELALWRRNTAKSSLAKPPSRALTASAAGALRESPVQTDVRQSSSGAKPTIYVVDNEPMLLDMIGLALANGPWEVKRFPDPAAALQSFAGEDPKPALLLSDYFMETMNGLELGARCRALHPPLRVILMSGSTGSEGAHEPAFVPDAFLPKPFHLQQLAELVESVLAASR